YNRLVSLLPYVEYYRKVDNNDKKFDNYTKFIAYCAKTKLIKNRYYKVDNYCWIGIRQSDVENEKVKEKISFFGDQISASNIRPNQNTKDFNSFLDKTSKLSKTQKKNNTIMLYNQKWAYILGEETMKKCIAINDNILLDFINDKFMIRDYLRGCGVSCFPSMIFESQNLNIDKLQANIRSDSWIVQEINGSGGYGTWLLNEQNQQEVLPILKKTFKRYLVSKYYKNNISINVTVMISEKQTTVFPASIQIIEVHDNRLMYRGNDFVAFRDISPDIKENVLITASNISNCLRKKGYIGIAGIDLIIIDGDIYFCEINPRFQASSPVLSRYLSENKKRGSSEYESFDLLKLNDNAFKGIVNTSINFYDEINYSCYFYFNDSYEKDDINNKLELLGDKAFTDGYTKNSLLDENSYLFKVIIDKKICQISPDNTVWISDNIKICKKPKTKEELKIALLNQGVRIDENIKNNLKKAVFDALDFYIEKDNLYVNSPIECHLVEFSPFSIVLIEGNYHLTINGKHYSKIIIETNKITNLKDYPERESLYLSTDRLRINPIIGCEYKSIGKGCQFCNFMPKSKSFSEKELIDAYEYARKNLQYSHIMIGGGTVIDFKNEETILSLVQYIHSKEPNKDITLMSIPVSENRLVAYKDAGITDVSFNIEILDQNFAEKYMPAKSLYDREYYLKILKCAADIWKDYGNVRTIIMVGFDRYEDILTNISYLDKLGVQPVLSVFRPLKGSNLYNNLPPSNEYLVKLYNDCQQTLYPHNLGPKCKFCKNNTLAL
ncbi:MAG: ATP-grasp domain-containing protein, partial [Clostridia bacterium]|nr:ATP-grasp domain-containing protein [Clostridia bacterium]